MKWENGPIIRQNQNIIELCYNYLTVDFLGLIAKENKTFSKDLLDPNNFALLIKYLIENKISSKIIPNKAMIGGGTNPESETESFAVKILFNEKNKKGKKISVKNIKKNSEMFKLLIK